MVQFNCIRFLIFALTYLLLFCNADIIGEACDWGLAQIDAGIICTYGKKFMEVTFKKFKQKNKMIILENNSCIGVQINYGTTYEICTRGKTDLYYNPNDVQQLGFDQFINSDCWAFTNSCKGDLPGICAYRNTQFCANKKGGNATKVSYNRSWKDWKSCFNTGERYIQKCKGLKGVVDIDACLKLKNEELKVCKK